MCGPPMGPRTALLPEWSVYSTRGPLWPICGQWWLFEVGLSVLLPKAWTDRPEDQLGTWAAPLVRARALEGPAETQTIGTGPLNCRCG